MRIKKIKEDSRRHFINFGEYFGGQEASRTSRESFTLHDGHCCHWCWRGGADWWSREGCYGPHLQITHEADITELVGERNACKQSAKLFIARVSAGTRWSIFQELAAAHETTYYNSWECSLMRPQQRKKLLVHFGSFRYISHLSHQYSLLNALSLAGLLDHAELRSRDFANILFGGTSASSTGITLAARDAS